jgi:acyl-CoA reductase-like NAD-dependent aldehyde dehydrogenase
MSKVRADHTVELVARAIYEAEQHARSWENGSARSRERSREYARNAIRLLNDDIVVLLSALNEAAAEHSRAGSRAAT